MKTLVLYCLNEENEASRYFFKTALLPSSENKTFIIICNGTEYEETLYKVQKVNNCHLLIRKTKSKEFQIWNDILFSPISILEQKISHEKDLIPTEINLYEKFDKFVFVTQMAVGPYIQRFAISDWVDSFTSNLSEKVKIVSPTANHMGGRCYPDINETIEKQFGFIPKDNTHCQSFVFCFDRSGLEILFKYKFFSESTIFPSSDREYMRICEVGMSAIFRKEKYSIFSLLYDQSEIPYNYTERSMDLWQMGPFYISPYETLFVKTSLPNWQATLRIDEGIDYTPESIMKGKTLIMFVFGGFDDFVKTFIKNGLLKDEDKTFIFISNNLDPKMDEFEFIKNYDNCHLLIRDNIGHDFQGWNTTLYLPPSSLNNKIIYANEIKHEYDTYLFQNYEKFIFLNSTVKGPYLSKYFKENWADLFTSKLSETVKMTGTSINFMRNSEDKNIVLSILDSYGFKPKDHVHIQSMAFSLSKSGLEILQKYKLFYKDKQFQKDKTQLIFRNEVAMSSILRKEGFDIFSFIHDQGLTNPERQGKTPDIWSNPPSNLSYFEIMFFKYTYRPIPTEHFRYDSC